MYESIKLTIDNNIMNTLSGNIQGLSWNFECLIKAYSNEKEEQQRKKRGNENSHNELHNLKLTNFFLHIYEWIQTGSYTKVFIICVQI